MAADSEQPFSYIRQHRHHFQVDLMPDLSELGESKAEDPLAPPYKPSLAHSPNQQGTPNNERETPRMEEETREQDDGFSERYVQNAS